MVSIKAISASLLGLVSLAVAQTSNFCTSADVCLTANVPATSGSQDLFLQIKAPTNSGWAGVGIGSQMRGSLIFLLYPNTNRNNVTVSPRLGRGNVMPEYESSIKFNLLPGTGIVDGNWVANIRCENCRSWSGGSINVNSNAQPFIWAVGTGQSIASDSPSARINQHATRSVFSLDLVKATGGNSANPFADNTGNNNTGGNNGGGNNDTNNGGEDLGGSAPLTKADKVLIAHGMALAAASWIFTAFL